MISFYVFIINMIFHQGQQTNENQARELYTKCTGYDLLEKKTTRTTERKNLRNLFFR